MATAKRASRASVSVTRTEFTVLRDDFVETKNDLRTLTQTVGTLTETVGTLAQTVTTLSEDVRDLRDEVRAQGVRIENVVMKEIRALGDDLLNATEANARQLAALEERLGERITNLEAAVRINSRDIRKNSEAIERNTEDIQRLSREVAQLRHDFDHRSERQELSALDERVTALEKHAGITKR